MCARIETPGLRLASQAAWLIRLRGQAVAICQRGGRDREPSVAPAFTLVKDATAAFSREAMVAALSKA